MMGRISKSLRFEVLTRDGYRCRYCGVTSDAARLHVDHVKPLSSGGSNDLENMVTACEDCNHGKGDRCFVYLPSGVSLTPDKRPARMAKMRASIGQHKLNMYKVIERDEIDCDMQIAFVWCEYHNKYELHSVPLNYLDYEEFYITNSKPIFVGAK